jgi:predicted amidohydrolase
MAEKAVRLSTTQVGWRETPAEADPFRPEFSLEAARQHCRAAVDVHAALVTQAGELGADLTVTGESIDGTATALTYLDDPSIFRTLVTDTGPYVHEVMSGIARRYRMHIVACFYEAEGDVIYNSAVLFGRDGDVIGRYHKVNLPIYETWMVRNGNGFPVFETDIAPLGMLICYDQMWPETAACLAVNGARIICHPSAASLADYQMRTRAMDEQVFYLSSTGFGSRIVAPNATILADAGEGDGVVTAEADLTAATLAPEDYWEYIYSGIRDHRERHLKLRQTGAYRVLSDPSPPALGALPPGGLNNTPETIRKAYELHKAELERLHRGEKHRYHWGWSAAPAPPALSDKA